MQETICKAIRAKRKLTVYQRTPTKILVRVVEPYALYPTENEILMLETWFVRGDSQYTGKPHWYQIPLADIADAKLCEETETFTPQPTYNPNNKKYARALCRVR